jgi:hypothetical protein
MAKKQLELENDIPQHILDSDHLSGVQKKAFAQAKRAAAREEAAAKKERKASKRGVKRTAEGGYGSGSGKEEKP